MLQMESMIQVLGQPDDKLLNRALYSHRFFKLVFAFERIFWEPLVSSVPPSRLQIFQQYLKSIPPCADLRRVPRCQL